MSAGEVSAVTVNYNTGPLLEGLLASLIDQPGLDGVVVVDNASHDASLTFLDSYRGVRLVRNDTNRGFGAACNQGAALAQCRYLLFINPDCRMAAGSVQRLAALLDADPGIGMAGPLILNPDGTEQRGCRRLLPDPHRALMRVLGLHRPNTRGEVAGFDLTGTPLPDSPVPVEAISGACLLIRRELFEKLGGWDEGYFLHCEDLDLCMRVRQAGARTLFVPGVTVNHVQGASSRRRPVFVLWHKHRGMWRYYSKFLRGGNSIWLTALVALGISLRFLALMPLVWWTRRA